MKKIFKILGIIFGGFLIVIICLFLYLKYFFDLKSFETTIKKKIYKLSNKYVYFDSATITLKHGLGVKLNGLKVINADNKTVLFSAKNGFINLKLIPLFYKKIEINKIILENGNLLLDFKPKKTTTSTTTSVAIPPNLKLKFLQLKNFKIHYIDSHLDINTENLYLIIKNFSFSKYFPFKLKFNSITGNNLKGKINIEGEFNFNNSFSPSKMFIKANIEVENLYGDQFYSYFIKKANFNIFTGNIKYLKANYEGNLKAYFSSSGIIKLKNFKIKHKTFKNTIKTKLLSFKYNYEMNGGHDINLKNFTLNIDNKLIFSGMFNFKNSKVYLKTSSKFFKPNLLYKYCPFNLNKVVVNNGLIKIKDFVLNHTKINTNLILKNISGNYNKFNFDNASGLLSYSDKNINFSGDILIKTNNFKIKDISIKNLALLAHIKSLSTNINNLKQTKIFGNFTLNSIVSYKNYKNIKIVTDKTIIKSQRVFANVNIKYKNIPYKLKGEFGIKDFHINASISNIDKDILKKFKIKKINNININLDILGTYSKPKLNSILAKFNNSELIYDNYSFSNIKGTISCDGKKNYCNITKLFFNFGEFNYQLNGKLSNFLSKNKSANLNVRTNGIDKIILEKLKISKNSIKNCNVNAKIKLKFKPKFSFNLENAFIKFNNSSFKFKDYLINKIHGSISIIGKKLSLNNITLLNNGVFYQINGSIPDIYSKKLICKLNLKSNSIDSTILKNLSIDSETVKNLDLNLDLFIKILPKFSVLITKGYIDFKNSNFYLKSPELKFKNIIGKILIKNNDLTFKNIKSNFNNGNILLNGSLANNYINLKIYGKNFYFSQKPKNKKTKKSEIKISNIIEKIKKFAEKFKGEIEFNFSNIKIYSNIIKDFSGKIKLHNKKLTLVKFKSLNSKNGRINIENFLFDFSKPLNIFKLKASIDNFEAAIFTNQKISGNMKKCLINLDSYFKSSEDFLKKLNGMIFIGIYNGYIYKFTFLGNLFSILNVYQLFKFKLPDISTNGFKYKIMAGKFDVKNGTFKTDKFVLISDSINLGFDGKFNLVNKKIKGQLVVQPLQTIGNLIGKIPVFGYIFGKKIILLYFKISGTYDNPKVIPQPSKTITKKTFNIFKNLFTLPKDIFTNPEKIFIPGMNSK